MKKVETDMRDEYKRADFGKLERGKFLKQAVKGTSVALIEPQLAKAFPSSEAVNEALRGLLALADETARMTGRPNRPARKRTAV
ncbi:MAG: hypothetical protein U5L74_13015 [Ideonella sp.]|nr:hypothetical protein [Ideonella sp.]